MDAVRRYNLFSGGGALPPKWGLGFMTRTPTAYTAERGARTRSPSSASAASRSTCSGSSRAGTITPTRRRSSGTRRGFPTRWLPRRARAAARAREPLVQPVRLADGAALREAAAVRRIAPRLERHRSRLLACPRRAQIFADHLREKVVRPVPRRAGRLQGGRGGWLRPLALARPGGVPLGPRRRAAAPDLRPAGAAAAHGPLSRR